MKRQSLGGVEHRELGARKTKNCDEWLESTSRQDQLESTGMKRGRITVTLLFVLTACLLAGSIGINYWTGLLAVESSRRLATQRAVIQQLEQVTSDLKDAESGHRGYLLTGENRYLEPYDVARRNVRKEITELQRLVFS